MRRQQNGLAGPRAHIMSCVPSPKAQATYSSISRTLMLWLAPNFKRIFSFFVCFHEMKHKPRYLGSIIHRCMRRLKKKQHLSWLQPSLGICYWSKSSPQPLEKISAPVYLPNNKLALFKNQIDHLDPPPAAASNRREPLNFKYWGKTRTSAIFAPFFFLT